MSYPVPTGDYPKPAVTRATRIAYLTKYTDPNQLEFFREWLTAVFSWDPGIKMDTDGETIVWFGGSVRLALGNYVFVDTSVNILTEEEVRLWYAPLSEFPADLDSLLNTVTQPVGDVMAATEDTVDGATDTVTDTVGGVTDTVGGITGGLLGGSSKGE